LVQDEARSRGALPAVVVGVVAVSAAAILIRLAEAPALAIAFWRCALGVAVLLPLALFRREKLPRGHPLRVLLASGAALGIHFALWIPSLDYTSVAASVVLVCTVPVFVALFGYLALGEKTSMLSLAGIFVAIAGSALIASDGSVGSAALFGNALAVGGAIAVAVHLVIGRSSRTGGIGVLPYSVVVYSAAAVVLLPLALLTGSALWGYSGETWFWLFTITLGPQILGHTVLNWALAYVEAAIVSGAILAEPVVAAVLAWLLLSETPALPTVIGGVVVLTGLYLLLRGRRKV
jgi:drug/metabolite transporter (DMT)-like permease